MNYQSGFKYRCSCGRLFKTEKRFENHNLICSVKTFSQNKSQREDEEEEMNEVPSQLEMYKLIVAQQREITKLKNIVKSLSKNNASGTKKKTDIISYLNSNHKPDLSIGEWLSEFKYTDDHYEILCTTGYVDSVVAAFQDNMTVKGNSVLPIQAFTQKQGILFKHEDKSWSAVTVSDFKKIMETIFTIILRRHKVWEKSAITDITNEKQQEKMLDRLNRIFCLDTYAVSNRDTKIKGEIYSFIKKKLHVEPNITLSYDI